MRVASAVLLAAFLLSACAGGSGSSGFDISPSSENQIIDQVLTARQCRSGEELTICPANEDALHVPGNDPTPAPENIEVVTGLSPTDIARCAATDEPTCRVAVQVAIVGLPTGAAYQLAARGFEPLSAWTSAGQAVTLEELGAAEFTAIVEVPAASVSLQTAVLVFGSGSGTAVGELRTLTETGATFAFVADPTPIPR
jgi:hypothetical protein